MKIADIILKNNYFEFNSTVKHQILGTAIGSRFTPWYAFIFMNYIEKKIQLWISFRYIANIFFTPVASEKELHKLLSRLHNFHLSLKGTH